MAKQQKAGPCSCLACKGENSRGIAALPRGGMRPPLSEPIKCSPASRLGLIFPQLHGGSSLVVDLLWWLPHMAPPWRPVPSLGSFVVAPSM